MVAFGPTEGEHQFAPGRRASLLLLAGIVVLAGFLRVHRLGDLPPGFFCDEAGLGYNAYSILETGRDENGVFLPLFVWSFDTSYKNPVFIYSGVLPVAALGLSEFLRAFQALPWAPMRDNRTRRPRLSATPPSTKWR